MQASGRPVEAGVDVKPRESMWLSVAILKMGGLWNTRDMTQRGAFLYTALKTLVVLVFCVITLSVYVYVIVAWSGFTDMLDSIAYCISMAVYCLKFRVIIFRSDEVQHITDAVQENFIIHSRELSTENRNIIKNAIKLARKITFVYATMYASSLVIYTILGPLISASVPFQTEYAGNDSSRPNVSNLTLPFNIWFPVDVTGSPRFEIAYVYLSTTGIIDTWNIVAIEVFFMTNFIYITGQFELLCDSIRNASERVTYRLSQTQLAPADGDVISERQMFASDKEKIIRHCNENTESSIISAMGKENITYSIKRVKISM
jgi:hypothetical protein